MFFLSFLFKTEANYRVEKHDPEVDETRRNTSNHILTASEILREISEQGLIRFTKQTCETT
uniref:Uncharacterized protein n=1 Tax=Helianthus annuus TaxID=4232 RepID=A0A251T4Z2_HELAN